MTVSYEAHCRLSEKGGYPQYRKMAMPDLVKSKKKQSHSCCPFENNAGEQEPIL
jgi:hypothetical protein